MAEIHHAEASLLSTTSGFVDYHGLLNQCLLLVVVSTSRSVLKSLQRYGLAFNFAIFRALFSLQLLPSSLTVLGLVFITFFIECGGPIRSSRLIRISTHVLTFTLILTLPAVQINKAALMGHPVHPAAAIIVLVQHMIVFLKLISFCMREKKDVPPRILAWKLAYFMFAPTLVFEYDYPRNEKIHWPFVIRRCCEVVFLCSLMAVVGERWIVPIIDRDPVSMKSMAKHPVQVILKLTSLAIPNHLCWIMFFYCYFHSALNLSGELLRFADRRFYLDWWNASCPSEFWRKWNVPVHRFAHRHVYTPLRKLIGSRFLSGLAVFLISALAHEYVASVAIRVPGSYMFVGMMIQPFMDYVMYNFIVAGAKEDVMSRRKWVGNMILWIGVVFGQPITAMMYVNDYRIYHHVQNRTIE